MTDHLPECWCAGRCPSYPGEDCPCRDCICVELRACEQRAFEKGWDEGEEVGYDRGRTSGLMSAEAAVEAIDRFDWIPPTYAKTKVVAAIRALKEKP